VWLKDKGFKEVVKKAWDVGVQSENYKLFGESEK